MKAGRYLKGKFLFTITHVKKEDDKLTIIDVMTHRCAAKEFEEAMMVAESEKRKPTVEFVNEKPEKFQIGVFYVLLDGSKVWTWQLDE